MTCLRTALLVERGKGPVIGQLQTEIESTHLPNVTVITLHPALQIVRQELQARLVRALDNELIDAVQRDI